MLGKLQGIVTSLQPLGEIVSARGTQVSTHRGATTAAMEAQIAAGVQQAPPMPMAAGFGCAGQPCAMETVEAATAAPM